MRTYYIYLYSQVNKLCLAQRTHYIYFYSQVNTLSCTKDSLYIFIQSGKTLRLVQWTHLLLYSLPWELQSYLGYKNCLPYCLYIHHIIRQPYCTYTIFECNNIVSMTYDDLHGHGQVLCLWFPGFNVKEQTVK